jgi:molybdopterin-containing oxidoreductase family iron-sulfur binding subunit
MSGPNRRDMLKLLAAGAAAGLAGCEKRVDILTAAVKAPPGIVPAVPDYYSSASLLNGYAAGLLVKHQDGRPVKVEGNPAHPASLGATDIFAQSMILSFYDPARDRAPSRDRQPAGWSRFKAEILSRKGKGLRVLSGASTSPSLAAQIAAIGARWHRWEAVSRDSVREGSLLAFGRPVDSLPDLSKADIIFAIDSDLLSSAPGHLRFARDFAARRNPTRTQKMSRLYAVESTLSLTGGVADHRFVAGPREIHAVLMGLAAVLLRNEPMPDAAPPWLAGVIADLKAHLGRALVHIGPDQPPEAHALVHAVNDRLDAPVKTLPTAQEPAESIVELVEDMQAGKVETLLILDGNPVFTAPADLDFKSALEKVPFSVSLSVDFDETGAKTTWWVPAAHPFEAWSDARAFDGMVSLIQPQAMPMFGGRSASEVLALFAGEEKPDGQALLRHFWRDRLSEVAWREALTEGVVEGSAAQPVELTARAPVMPPAPSALLTILFRPEPHLWDGRFAGNGWLQELPRPFTKLTWDNPLLIAPGLARQQGLANGDMVKIGEMEAPVWIQPGQAEDCVVALFGGGRGGAGFDYYPLRGQSQPASLEKTGKRFDLAATEHHTPIAGQGEDLAKQATLAAFMADPTVLRGDDPTPSLYTPPPRSETAWGMSIDLNACIGCNACVIACQAENNIPVVGKDQVLHQREMHWLRIDRYYSGEADSPDIAWQPVLCMHCEEAPCEVVCPVGATVHDAEGLNVMVYNRCVGTRFCSNNCPYKVRRFNYLAYSTEEARTPESRNPEVSVRSRGVMEKCTFCLQKIAAARIQADIENRPIKDGEVKTACQSACPTQAFTFGDIHDLESQVAQRKSSPLTYRLLGELNTRPRVTYEGKIRNEG